MPNINTTSVFKNDLYIPLAVANPTSVASQATPNNSQALTDMITDVEKQILINVNGLTFYNDLQAALADLPNADQKWQDLVNGVEYDGKFWEGLNNAHNLLAYAIYYSFNSRNVDFYTSVGMAQPNVENSTRTNHTQKLVSMWQTFLNKYQRGNYFNYSYFNRYDYCYFNETNVSLWQYLNDNAETYDFMNSRFRLYEPVNSLGL